MSFPYEGTAVVTGAGSGIGRATAMALAAQGMDLALVDLREDRLAKTAGMIEGAKVTVHAMDVADRGAVAALPDMVAREHGAVSVLVNNAGVALGGDFREVSEADFDWLFEINFHAPVRLVRAFLPALEACPRARIVNVSSIFGVIAPPGQTAYAASKFALRGFSEALRHELEGAGSSVGVTTVHPGGIATNIARDARVGAPVSGEELAARQRQADKLLVMPPDRAAALIVDAMERDAPRLLIGRDAKLAATIQRLFPTNYLQFMRARMDQ